MLVSFYSLVTFVSLSPDLRTSSAEMNRVLPALYGPITDFACLGALALMTTPGAIRPYLRWFMLLQYLSVVLKRSTLARYELIEMEDFGCDCYDCPNVSLLLCNAS